MMADDDNVLSDDAKWFIQMAAVYITLAFVLFRSWEKRKGRAQDAVTMNGLRWQAQRLAVREKSGLTEFEIQELQDNAAKARKALEIIERGYGTYQCPWQEDGHTCLVANKSVAKLDSREAILEHVKEAYEEEDKQIRRRIHKRQNPKATEMHTSRRLSETTSANSVPVAVPVEVPVADPAGTKDRLLPDTSSDETRLLIF